MGSEWEGMARVTRIVDNRPCRGCLAVVTDVSIEGWIAAPVASPAT